MRKLKSTIFRIHKMPPWAKKWYIKNNKSFKDLEKIINSGEEILVVQGNSINAGKKFNCIRCNSVVKATNSRLRTSIKSNKYTGFCRKCMSSVRHNVSIGIRKQSHGYVMIQKSLIPEQNISLCDWSKPVLEHRYIMAVKLNRPLNKNEVVHHKDGNKMNNDINNLELWNNSHPSGQRIEDKIKWAKDILELYKDF